MACWESGSLLVKGDEAARRVEVTELPRRPAVPPVASPAPGRDARARLLEGKQEGEGDPSAPGGVERHLDDAAALVGVDEAVGRREDAAMLGDGVGAHPEGPRAGSGFSLQRRCKGGPAC